MPSRKANRKKPNKGKQSRLKTSAPKKSARRQYSANTETVLKKSTAPIGKLFEELVAVQARLRAPGGCPWDREQTHATLKTYLIEEAYEVLDALENGNPLELAEELGDLLLQILFHSDLALEAGTFDISDVVVGIRDKMIRRHPHVFGNVKADTAAEVLKNWTQLKAQEKQSSAGNGSADRTTVPSELEGVPRNLPALLEAYQLTRRASRVGFDWESVEGIFEKLHEEVLEIKSALKESNRFEVEEEVGDILFVCVNLSRFLGFDPEVSLKRSNSKFKTRFHSMEEETARSGRQLAQLSKEELEELWNAAKVKLKVQTPPGSQS